MNNSNNCNNAAATYGNRNSNSKRNLFEDLEEASNVTATANSFNNLNSSNSNCSSTYKTDQPFDIPFKLSSSHNTTISQNIPSSMKFLLLKKMLREATVVCCTCSSVTSDYLKGLHFTRVIIDDAS